MLANHMFESEGGEIRAWIEQESIHLLECDKNLDPVELTSDTTRQLAETLKQFADKIAA